MYFLFLHDHLFLRNVVTETGNPVPESEHNNQQFTGLLLAIYSFLVSEYFLYIILHSGSHLKGSLLSTSITGNLLSIFKEDRFQVIQSRMEVYADF